MFKLNCYFTFLFLLSSSTSFALQLPLPPAGNDLCGKVQSYVVKAGDTMGDIARKYDLGYFEMVAANPQVNPKHLQPGTALVVPTQFVIPRVPYKGAVINLGTMRMYYFPPGKNYFYTYPVGIGRKDWGTPLGVLRIVEKIRNPVWYVPQSIYEYRKQEGDPVPKVVGPGPDNPLGLYALRLSKRTYLIHDTNDPASVGVRSSAGCIHLYTEDIKALFEMIGLKEQVIIINEPYVVGWSADALYMEAHLPLEEQRAALSNASAAAVGLVTNVTREGMNVDWELAKDVIQDHTGIPEVIGTKP